MSIRSRLVLAFSACLLLAGLLICSIVFFYVKNAAEREFHVLAISQLERIEERINTFMEPGVQSLKYLASLDVVRNSRGKLQSYAETTETTVLSMDKDLSINNFGSYFSQSDYCCRQMGKSQVS